MKLPQTAQGLALLCWGATALIAAGVGNLLLLGQGVPMDLLRLASIPASLAAGLLLFYLGHCAMKPPAKVTPP